MKEYNLIKIDSNFNAGFDILINGVNYLLHANILLLYRFKNFLYRSYQKACLSHTVQWITQCSADGLAVPLPIRLKDRQWIG